MKVAMICDVMGQPNNGTTLAALNLIRYLRDAGHTVTVVAPGGEASDGYLPVRVWHAGPLIDRILRMNGVELAVPDKQLLEAVIREADVVHLLIPLPLARAALRIARRLGKPVTASFHCQAENITAHLGMMNAGWLNRLIYRNFYRKVYRWCTAVHYPTEFIREVFETATHPTPAHVISNGVNDMFRLPDSRPENGKFTVVCSGRYSREKAQQQLLRAAALCRHRDDIRLILAGDGPRRKHYLRLAKLARKRRVHLRIRKKTGLFFLLRPYFRRRGLWAGLLLFVPLLLWSQGLVWAVDASGLTTGQQARAASVLRETVSLMPGSIVTQEKLAAGEYALLQSGEFSWVSLNFQDGRLVLEAAEAKPVPEIAAGTLHGLRAKAAGTVVSTNLVSGTMLVVPGQAVEKGQGLIGTARAERDGTLIFQPAAGSVRAQFEWEFAEELPLMAATYQLTGNTVVQRRIFLAGRVFPLPSLFSPADDSTAVTRHLQPELLGLTLPLSVEETTYYEQAENEIHSSEDEARALARLHGLQALQNDYPDAEFVAQKVDVTTENDMLHYRVVYTIIADICT